MVHEAVHRGHHGPPCILHQVLKYLHPLSGQKVSMDIGAVKQKIPGGIQPCILFKIAEVIVKLPGPGIVVSHN